MPVLAVNCKLRNPSFVCFRLWAGCSIGTRCEKDLPVRVMKTIAVTNPSPKTLNPKSAWYTGCTRFEI